MRRLAALLTVVLAVVLAVTAHAQAVIDSGMSRAQVVERFGKPLAERTAGTQTYLFYRNGAERRAGMQDVVILDGDKVVDAVFRGTAHKYSGRSSSPVEISAATARAIGRRQPPAAPGTPMAEPAMTRGAAGAVPVPSRATVLPAAKAQQEDVARPMPPAGSGERNAQKAAASAAAAKAAADSAAAAKKPANPNTAPTKKP